MKSRSRTERPSPKRAGKPRSQHRPTTCLRQAGRGRKEYGGLKLSQAKRLQELEKENARLKRVVAELSLEKQVLKEVAEGNF